MYNPIIKIHVVLVSAMPMFIPTASEIRIPVIPITVAGPT